MKMNRTKIYTKDAGVIAMYSKFCGDTLPNDFSLGDNLGVCFDDTHGFRRFAAGSAIDENTGPRYFTPITPEAVIHEHARHYLGTGMKTYKTYAQCLQVHFGQGPVMTDGDVFVAAGSTHALNLKRFKYADPAKYLKTVAEWKRNRWTKTHSAYLDPADGRYYAHMRQRALRGHWLVVADPPPEPEGGKIRVACDPEPGAMTDEGLIIGPHPEHPVLVVEAADGTLLTTSPSVNAYREVTVRPAATYDEALARPAYFKRDGKWYPLDDDDLIKILKGGVYVAVE